MTHTGYTLIKLLRCDLFDKCFSPQLQSRLADIARIDDCPANWDDLGPEEITALISRYDIILSGWSANRQLPETYSPPKPQLWCNVTGTVGNTVRQCHLERGLRLVNWGNCISHTIAESAHMLILACSRRIRTQFSRVVLEESWGDVQPRTLFGKNVSLLGFGQIARLLVPLLKPYGVKIKAYDPYVQAEAFREFGVEKVEAYQDLFDGNTDVVSLHAGKTEETNNLVSADMMNRLPEYAVIVNTGRGNILNENDLLLQHSSGRLFSGLDVFAVEPLPKEHPLRKCDRCLITCHNSGPTLDTYPLMGERAYENIRRYTQNEPLLQELSAEMLKRMT